MQIPQIIKRPEEMYPVGLKYIAPDISAGATIISAAVTISPSGGVGQLSKSGAPILDGDTVSQVVYGGVNGENYDVIFLTTTSEGHIYEDKITIKVRSI